MRRASLTLIALSVMASAAVAAAPPSPPPRTINMVSDSAPGWLPSEAMEIEARQVAETYWRAIAKGDDQTAWSMARGGLEDLMTFDKYQASNATFRKDVGRLKVFQIDRVTWGKDAPSAPQPGIYAAVDFTSTFSKAARQCGYLVLFKATEAERFEVRRIENNYLTDAMYKKLAKQKSPAEAERIWQQLSSYCPNYKPPK